MTSNTCDKYDQIGRKTYVVSESVRIKMLTTTGEDLYFLTTMVMACTVDLRLQVRDLDIVYKEIAMMQITKLAAILVHQSATVAAPLVSLVWVLVALVQASVKSVHAQAQPSTRPHATT